MISLQYVNFVLTWRARGASVDRFIGLPGSRRAPSHIWNVNGVLNQAVPELLGKSYIICRVPNSVLTQSSTTCAPRWRRPCVPRRVVFDFWYVSGAKGTCPRIWRTGKTLKILLLWCVSGSRTRSFTHLALLKACQWALALASPCRLAVTVFLSLKNRR